MYSGFLLCITVWSEDRWHGSPEGVGHNSALRLWWVLLVVLFNPGVGDSMFYQKLSKLVLDYTASYPRRWFSSYSPPQEPIISHINHHHRHHRFSSPVWALTFSRACSTLPYFMPGSSNSSLPVFSSSPPSRFMSFSSSFFLMAWCQTSSYLSDYYLFVWHALFTLMYLARSG
jgi:hypothetical protein